MYSELFDQCILVNAERENNGAQRFYKIFLFNFDQLVTVTVKVHEAFLF